MTASLKSKITVGILLLPMVVLGALISWPIVRTLLHSGSPLARFAAPGNSANEMWFYEGDGHGFRERDLLLYAKPQGWKPQLVAHLDWFPYCWFSSAQWSQ